MLIGMLGDKLPMMDGSSCHLEIEVIIMGDVFIPL